MEKTRPVILAIVIIIGLITITGSGVPYSPIQVDGPEDILTFDSETELGPVSTELGEITTTGIKIAVIGDSITVGRSYYRSYTYRLDDMLSEEYSTDVDVVNYGVWGDTLCSMSLRIEGIIDESPDILIITGGFNDFDMQKPIEESRACLYDMVKLAQAAEIAVITMTGPVHYLNLLVQTQTLLFYELHWDASQDQELLETGFINLWGGTRDYILAIMSSEEYLPLFFDDGLHPNQSGHDMIAEVIFNAIVAELSQ